MRDIFYKNTIGRKSQLLTISKFLFIPLLFYLLLFFLLSFPLLLNFNTHIFADNGDGLQNYWNLWWVNKAVTELHTSAWFTTYLHYPQGVTLIGHTLNIFNGLVGVLLLKFLTPIQTYNFIVIFSFVIGGFTSFLLSYHLTKGYRGSLLAGYIYTFSEFHFAHAEGHMQLVSLEWIPLFILAFHLLLSQPNIIKGIFASIALFLVFLCDYYYFFYCVLIGIIIFIFYLYNNRNLISKQFLLSIFTFVLTSTIFCLPTIFRLIYTNINDPLLGAHLDSFFSLNLLSVFIPGGHWRYAYLTNFFWSQINGNIHETSVYLGWSVITTVIFVKLNNRIFNNGYIKLSFFIAFIFFILSLGPHINIGRYIFDSIPMPYSILNLIPIFKLSGMPIRMVVIVFLYVGVIYGVGVEYLLGKGKWYKLVGIVLILFMLIEYLPKPIPVTNLEIPEYVRLISKSPGNYGVIDQFSPIGEALYYQTIYNKPMAFGYISRVPQSVNDRDNRLTDLLSRNMYVDIYKQFNLRYFVIPNDVNIKSTCKYTLTDNGNVRFYDIGSCL